MKKKKMMMNKKVSEVKIQTKDEENENDYIPC